MASTKTEIMSITTIKPSSPTPPHLQTFKLSLLDQLSPNVHINLTFFYPYSSDASTDSASDPYNEYTCVFFSKSKLLQKSISETLKIFYPLAGRLQDDSTITCNDEGVVFTESKTNYHLSDILTSPEFDLIYSEFVSTNYHDAMLVSNGALLLFNFVLFRCGGTAVSVAAAHKVLDMSSLMTFLKSLSAACCGSAEHIVPDFHTAQALLPSREMPRTASFGNARKCSTRSFIFTASKIEELKSIAASSLKKDGYEFGYLSRVTVVMAFLWQCAVTTFISQRGFFKPTVMLQAANLRNRIGQPLPSNAMGNLSFVYATDIVEKENDVQWSEFLKKLLELKASIDEKAKKFNADEVIRVMTQEARESFNKKDAVNSIIVSSWCRFEFYEFDFGMGKPVWVTSIAPELLTNCVILLDTKEEGGVEALVYLQEEEMKAFQCNQELLNFAVLCSTGMISRKG